MSRPSPARHRGRSAPARSTNRWLAELGFDAHSLPVIGWTALILAIGFGPLLAGVVFDATGTAAKILAALGPVLVCLAFAGLVWKYGMRYAPEMGWSNTRVWLLVGMFVALAGLVGWGLFVSV